MKVEIYGRPGCAFCDLAKELCERTGVAYDYKIVGESVSREQLEEMVGSPVRSVPQIFVTTNGFSEYVGGFNELKGRLTHHG